MSLFTGRRVNIGWAKETPARGTGMADTTALWSPHTTLSFDDKTKSAFVENSACHIIDAAMTGFVTDRFAEGDIEGQINIDSFGLLLLATLGGETYSLAEATVGKHAYTYGDTNQHPSLTIWMSDPIGSMRFRLAMLNSLSIEVTPGEIVKYTASFISKVHQDMATATTAPVTDHQFISTDLTFKVADSLGGLVAATAINLKKLTLVIEKNTEKLETLGTLDPTDIVNKGLKITGTLELNYEDRTWKNYMLSGQARSMLIDLQGSKLLGATLYPRLYITFDKVWFDAWETSRGLNDISSQTIKFTVFYNLNDNRMWEDFYLQNTVIAAY